MQTWNTIAVVPYSATTNFNLSFSASFFSFSSSALLVFSWLGRITDVCRGLRLRNRNPLFAEVWKSAGEILRNSGVDKALVCFKMQRTLLKVSRREEPDIISQWILSYNNPGKFLPGITEVWHGSEAQFVTKPSLVDTRAKRIWESGMSFLKEVEGFRASNLKSVRTRVTTAEGRKVKEKSH